MSKHNQFVFLYFRSNVRQDVLAHNFYDPVSKIETRNNLGSKGKHFKIFFNSI